MPENRIDSTVTGENTQADFSVGQVSTDGISPGAETRWIMEDWEEHLAFFSKVAPCNQAINAKSTWTVGKGFTSKATDTKVVLELIKGWGNDTFNTILENMIRTYYIGGDSFAEIILDDDGDLLNLKCLDPSTITVIIGQDGLIDRYEQETKVKDKKGITKISKEKMFHLSLNRVADNVHGTSIIPSIKELLLAREEAITDYKKVMHRFIQPQWKFKLKTDDQTEIAAYKTKMDAIVGEGKNIYEPFDVAESELLAVAPNSTLNPLTWIEALNKYIFQGVGVPQFIVGGGTGFTEASEKIAYLAYQQTIEEEQLYIEEQVREQLGYKIELTFPASLENELLSDQRKDGAINIDQSETTAGVGQ